MVKHQKAGGKVFGLMPWYLTCFGVGEDTTNTNNEKQVINIGC